MVDDAGRNGAREKQGDPGARPYGDRSGVQGIGGRLSLGAEREGGNEPTVGADGGRSGCGGRCLSSSPGLLFLARMYEAGSLAQSNEDGNLIGDGNLRRRK